MCITESHCCAAELKVTLKISHTSTQFLEKNNSGPWVSLLPDSFLLTPGSLFSLQRKQVLLQHVHNPNFTKKLYFVLRYS